MVEMKSLNDVFNEWYSGGGFFSILKQSQPNAPYLVNASELDMLYHGGRSGGKIPAPFVDRLVERFPNDYKGKIVNAVYSVYGQNWGKLWATLSLDYNPIENYRMTETEQNENTQTRTPDITENETKTPNVTETRNKTTTPGVTETETQTRTPELSKSMATNGYQTETDSKTYGFNSADPVGSGKDTETETGTRTETESGTDTVSREVSKTGNDAELETVETSGTETTARTQTGTETTSGNGNRTLTRSGNIGVTTSQQMIQSERDLWVWNFFESVFQDLDKYLTCPLY